LGRGIEYAVLSTNEAREWQDGIGRLSMLVLNSSIGRRIGCTLNFGRSIGSAGLLEFGLTFLALL
jgi:hypothetical protein